jgi:hypothetical protein
MKMSSIIKIALALIPCCSTSVMADEGKDESGKGRQRKIEHRQNDGQGSYFQRHGYGRLNIPEGHYPSPGECRIWFPDRPAGQQKPPGNYHELERRVPPGAWLIHHPEDDPGHLQVAVCDEYSPDEHRRSEIRAVGEFEIGSGKFVRVILNR